MEGMASAATEVRKVRKFSYGREVADFGKRELKKDPEREAVLAKLAALVDKLTDPRLKKAAEGAMIEADITMPYDNRRMMQEFFVIVGSAVTEALVPYVGELLQEPRSADRAA
ncbi:hypothetical protein H0O01_00780 [Candidatus Micrarchaeota archaeon]|nr:hypothetical protein [Candidatus Micrarchaeota archaeon]